MSRYSSVNFKKTNYIQAEHNDRTRPPSYLLSGEIYINRTAKEALNLKNQIIAAAQKKYTERTGQKFQAKSYEWSAVVNLKADSTMEDLERLAEHFSQKYGFQCYQIAIHRDEGHIDDDGIKQINHHAHLEFVTLDRETGKNNYRRELISPKILRQIQTETAEILGMERGIDRRLSGVKRIEPRKYAQMKEAERAVLKELKKRIQSPQNHEKGDIDHLDALINTAHPGADKEGLRRIIKNSILTNTQKELDYALNKLAEPIKETEIKKLQMDNFKFKTELALAEVEKIRKFCSNKGFKKEFFADLNAFKRDIKAKTIAALDVEKNGYIRKHLADIIIKHRKKRQITLIEAQTELNPTLDIPQEPKTQNFALNANMVALSILQHDKEARRLKKFFNDPENELAKFAAGSPNMAKGTIKKFADTHERLEKMGIDFTNTIFNNIRLMADTAKEFERQIPQNYSSHRPELLKIAINAAQKFFLNLQERLFSTQEKPTKTITQQKSNPIEC